MPPASSSLSKLRHATRIVTLIAFLAAALAWPAGLAWLVPALSPHVALARGIAERAVGLTVAAGAPILLVVAWRRRWFCRWLCPTGWVLERCGRLRNDASVAGYRRVPRLGRWFSAATLAGALLGVPLFLWLDPLGMLGGVLNAAQHPAAAWGAGIGMLLLIALAVAWPGLWCARCCPLGGAQDWLADAGRLAMRRLRRAEGASPAPGTVHPRRAALAAGVGVAGALALPRLVRADAQPLRPPGAADEETFRTLCLRCGNCVRLCPTGILWQDLRSADPTALLTPTVRFDGGYCKEECRACGLSCPSGAIARLSLAEKNRRAIGRARIDLADCRLTHEQECGHCARLCPHDAIEEGFSEATWTASVRVLPSRCNGCGACVGVCPPRVITIEPPAGRLARPS